MPQNRMALALVALFVAAATAPAAARTLREAAAAPAAAPAVAPSDGIPMAKEERAEIAALFDA